MFFATSTPLGADFDPLANEWGEVLQLGDNLVDLAEDLADGQLRLPLEDLDRFGVDRADLLARRWTRAISELIAFEVAQVPAAAGSDRRSEPGRAAAGCALLTHSQSPSPSMEREHECQPMSHRAPSSRPPLWTRRPSRGWWKPNYAAGSAAARTCWRLPAWTCSSLPASCCGRNCACGQPPP
ncbi:squalene/phytoene synthase family protein [Streptomyces sp. NPDC096205]|uniref:squalene/phytoene synthase family protein n=1 Tax=Streptomyces sp. NPDC096205 TaxID=3366081 RepID=UPI0037FAE807